MIGDLIKLPGDDDDSSEKKKGAAAKPSPNTNPVAAETQRRGSTKGPTKSPPLRFGRRRWFPVWLRRVLLFGLLLALVGAVIIWFKIKPFREDAYALDLSTIDQVEKASLIYDSRGRELGRIFVENRRPVTLEEVPLHLVQALMAIEDSRFFQHNGIDYIGIARAMLRNVKNRGSRAHGASTITMQLARNSYDIGGRTLQRKITEAFLAHRIEERYPKAKILEFYLNRIYFGEGYHGVLAASQGYFGKPASELTVGESAILAGMIKAPNGLSPRRHAVDSKKRRDYVLTRMVVENFLTEEAADGWKAAPIVTAPKVTDEGRSSYVYEQIRQRVGESIGKGRALRGGFHIYTTIDIDLQRETERSVIERIRKIEERNGYEHQTYDGYVSLLQEHMRKLRAEEIPSDTPVPNPEYLQASALVVDNTTGAVRAMVGGRNFSHSKYDRALQSSRAVGTAFTPIVFASAFEGGELYPGSLLKDTPINNQRIMIGGLTGILGEWGLEAAGQHYKNTEVTARHALVHSKNAATVRLGEKVGLERLKDTAERMGITDPLKDYPSSYLGSSAASLADMTLAYTAFPQGGSRPAGLYFIRKIVDDEGRTIFHREGVEHGQIDVINAIAAYQVHSCLEQVPQIGTAKGAKDFGLVSMPVAGKTGTHYNFKDLWFIGYSSEVTCGVWVGFDAPKTIYKGAFSNAIALPVWVDIMNEAAKSYIPRAFSRPPGLQTIEICDRSGRCATDACYEQELLGDGRKVSIRTTYTEVVGEDVRIDEFCDVHSGEPLASHLLAAALTPKAEDEPTLTPGAAQGAKVIQMRSPTVLGDDPYQAFRPVLKAIAVRPNDGLDGEDAPRVERAVLARPAFLGNSKYEIKLDTPSPIEIDE